MSRSKSPGRAIRKNRLSVSLNQRLDHALLAYAAVASAAGVGIMALAEPSLAEIVYTPAHQLIGQGKQAAIDLNGDGTVDFTIQNNAGTCVSGPQCRVQDLVVTPTGQNLVVLTSGNAHFAQALSNNVKVDAADNFTPGYVQMDRCKATLTSYYLSGPWINVSNRYLALKFYIGKQIHYGWARVSVSEKGPHCSATAILTGYAYETQPNGVIVTGRTKTVATTDAARPEGTLGALAFGSAGLVAWRRDEEEVGAA